MANDIIAFSKDLAQQLFDSEQVFVVDFDLAWVWLGYATKASAKRKLSRNLIEGKDYSTDWLNVAHSNGLSASKVERIMLTVDAFKALGMMAGTEQGKKIREYFLDCERQAQKAFKSFPERLTGEIPEDPAIAAIKFIGAAIDIALPAVQEEFRAGMKIESICIKFPEYRKALEPHKPKLLLKAELLTPTDLGRLMEPPRSGQAVNKLLCDRGLQEKTGEKNPAYRLIGQGNEFGMVVADTARGHGKTVQHIRWYESVMDLLGAS